MSANPVSFAARPPRERDRYRLLLEITGTVARAPSLPDAMREVAPPMLELTHSNLLCLSLHDPHRDRLVTRYWKQNREHGEFESSPAEDAAGWTWKYQQPLAIADTEREQRFPQSIPRLLNQGVRSLTALPLSTASQQFGALSLGRDVAEVLPDDDVELLSHVALISALALEKQRTHRAFEEQQSLLEISRELSATLDLEKLLPAILGSLRSIARYDRALLTLLQGDGGRVKSYGSAQEWESVVNRDAVVPVAQSLSGRAIETRQVVFFNAEELRALPSPWAEAMNARGIHAVCSVPLIARDRVWGALNTSSESEGAFGPAEVEYLQQVARQIAIALQNASDYRQIETLKDRLARENRRLVYKPRSAEKSEEIIGESAALKHVLEHAAIVADTDSTVLLTGETGTGKERVARMIHQLSRRREGPFIKLNCAAIPTGLLESELFGHEKGAFTGAVSQKIGRLELADRGTLLLDEVGEIPLELQPKLLRVLQDQEFERLGGTKTIRVDARIIAATNRDLLRAVERREFREDLFYRLRVFPLHLPALRERREDIPNLIRHFVDRCAGRMGRPIELIPPETIRALTDWSWPGNIRELENFIERSVILSEDGRLNPPLQELREEILQQAAESEGTLRERERGHIVEILRHTKGVLSGPEGAAARLGLKRTTLQYKMQRLGIERKDYLE